MEVRGEDKEMGLPRRRDQSVGSGAIIPQPVDHHQHHPVYHHQLNPQMNKPRRDPEPDPDPVQPPAPAATPAANRSTLKSTQPVPSPQQHRPAPSSAPMVRYRKCLKNHAAATGGHVLDGCGEFMPSGEEGTPEALNCAACECHRSFHQKEVNGESQYAPNSYYAHAPRQNSTGRDNIPPLPQHRLPHGFSTNTPSTVPIAPVMMTFGGGSGGGLAESSSEDLMLYQGNAAGQPSVQPPLSKKRFRTKFNQDQKDKMMEFAEKLGWKMQKQDEEEVQQFCAEVGVKRRVFKVWMHNHKQYMKTKKEM